MMKISVSKVYIFLFLASAVLAQTGVEKKPQIIPQMVFKALEAGKTQTVVIYGTSVSIMGQWANEVEAYFQRLYPGQVTFFNSAQSGMHSIWGVENLKERVLDKQPDLVFIEFAINDAATKHGISTTDCRNNLDTMIKALKAQNPRVEIILQTMNPAWDSPKVPKSFASDRPHLEEYYQVYRDYAMKHNFALVDNFLVWNKLLQEDPERFKKMVPDGIHPDSAGSSQIAWPTIKKLLDKGRALSGGSLTVNIWPDGKMPGHTAAQPESISKPERTDAIRISNISTPTLTLYPTSNQGNPAPAMIVCPGGAYSYVVVDKEGSEIAEWLNSIGINALVLKYRVPDNRQAALQDIQRALRVTRAHANEWNIDPERLGVIGFSAGGNLSAKASNLFDRPAYDIIDELDQQSCRPDFAILAYPAYLGSDGKISGDLDLDADIPPTLIIHSEDDKTYIQGSKLYAAGLKERKHCYQFMLYQTGGHGYGLRCELEARVWPKDAEKWLNTSGILNAETMNEKN